MSAIFPDGTLKLLRGISLDKGYNHTYRFSNETEQRTFFENFTKPNTMDREGKLISFTLHNQQYQRHTSGVLRVGIGCDFLLDINYMMFQNNLFSVGKWFYAFVDNVNYINQNCSEIEFTIDVMQTWKFDYELGECFVEREHVENDRYGANLVAENLETGEYTNAVQPTYKRYTQMLAGIMTTRPLLTQIEISDDAGNYKFHPRISYGGGIDVGGNMTNTIFTYFGFYINSSQASSLTIDKYLVQDFTTENELNQVPCINEVIAAINDGKAGINPDELISVFTMPADLLQSSANIMGENRRFTGRIDMGEFTLESPILYNYIPINKKLLTYPYCFFTISSSSGATNTYKWEDFEDENDVKFWHIGTLFDEHNTALIPIRYRNSHINFDEMVGLDAMPIISFASNSYQTWLNQNRNSVNASIITHEVNQNMNVPLTISRQIGAALNVNLGGIITSTVDGAVNDVKESAAIYQILAQQHDKKNLSNRASYSLNELSLLATFDRLGFTINYNSIKPEFAKIIDDYFNMYGYAVNRVKIPQTTSRPYWNYIKTSNCIVHPVKNKGLPAEDENLISAIYNKGITFWNKKVEIGDYSLAPQNRP